MKLATLRFLESAPAALAVGLMLLPRLMGEEGARFKPAVAVLALARAVFGLFLIAAIARSIIPPQKTIDLPTLVDFALGTVVGKAWLATQIAALIFAAIAALRATLRSKWLESAALWPASRSSPWFR